MKNPDSTKMFDEHQTLMNAAGAVYVPLQTKFQKGDVLCIVDMQNDFVPKDDAPDGGRFGVAEGASAGAVIIDLIKKAAAGNATIVATRDYHPINHCSFNTHNGPFPPHCVQGSKGSFFFPPIEAALTKAKSASADVRVVFKGFVPQVDSFGGIQYGPKYFKDRALGKDGCEPEAQCHSCSAIDWTGSFALDCSNIDEDINAPPDVMAIYSKKSLAQELQACGAKRLFCVGLAMDFCVLDTALNAATAKVVPDIYMPVEATRAAHIPGIGSFGSGFLSDPNDIVQKTKTAGVKLCHVDGIR